MSFVSSHQINRSGTAVSGYYIMSETSYKTDGIELSWSADKASLLAVATNSMTIGFQASIDGKSYFDPYDVNGSYIGIINKSFATTTGQWTEFEPPAGSWLRLAITGGNDNGSLTATLGLTEFS